MVMGSRKDTAIGVSELNGKKGCKDRQQETTCAERYGEPVEGVSRGDLPDPASLRGELVFEMSQPLQSLRSVEICWLTWPPFSRESLGIG